MNASTFTTCWLPNDKQVPTISSLHITLCSQAKVLERVCLTYLNRLYNKIEISRTMTSQSEIIIGTFNETNQECQIEMELDGFIIRNEQRKTYVLSLSEQGLLYGTFHLIEQLQLGSKREDISVVQNPSTHIRMLNHWDNMDGTIERGYAGRSIFFDQDELSYDAKRIQQYADLLASVGINKISINNVNVHRVETKLITESKLRELKELADIFSENYITLYLSINYASPIELGELQTADPLDDEVKTWWKQQTKRIYQTIPGFGGFIVKADSEHRPGPFTYGRTHADGANMLAKALAPFGGNVFWRCFVYDCLQDWRDRTTDRARAAFDHFQKLDGEFDDNVILQIKNGPMDFQVREPVSPLIGALKATNYVIEFQVTQEYTGQQIDLCYLMPQWSEVLAFDTQIKGEGTTVSDILSGNVYPSIQTGITAVVNVGNDSNWTGHEFAQANLYGYGRLAWNPRLTARTIANDWVNSTYPSVNEEVKQMIEKMLMESWVVYENYTAPLGVGWMVKTGHHYGPDVNGYEYSPWGTYHFSDRDGIGVDRTKSGSNYVNQYTEPVAEVYEDMTTCPDELLLFFHHVPYTHKLHSGKTVIQHIYDSHFEGVKQVERLILAWQQSKDELPDDLYEHISHKLNAQLENAKEWRDKVNTYYYRVSGIHDQHDRKIYR
ncbi:alpha-glucuronidase family glycosyl hydrolase [Alkalicoccobacillus murimartini]|uniref:Xylan alpha-1,2-glucuronidase n=1 Tax=Alkalicoccobacillus murimartini TaxID=171685 RepID=A0ABT9YCD0_9BACI|nr:alpha-glucuronidase family glycosyl hydrolase [Alkalicoccobacillus murimartini]MDQ0205472.1 alpha-glucuronidase [Alkalicoccobacillus murimartini]